MLRALLSFFLLVAAAPAAQMTTEEAAAVQAALNRGVLLFGVDRAAWVSTDDMLAKLGEKGAAPIRGWTVERDAEPGGFIVTYFAEGSAGPVAVYSGQVRDRKLVASRIFPDGSRPPLTASQLRLKVAADTARAFTGYDPCTPARFNVALVPPDDAAAPIEAYLLSAQTKTGIYPIGGHYLMKIADGEVASHRPFMKSCMNVDARAKGKKGSPESLVVSHLLDRTPTEIHVFMSIWMGKPIYVMTLESKSLWAVEGNRIRLIKRD
jgi:hypothetical protein